MILMSTYAISDIHGNLAIAQQVVRKAIEGNTQLRVPSVRPVERDKFLRAYANKDFRAGIRKSGIKFQVDLMRIKHVFNKKVIQKSNSYGLIIIGK